MNDIEERVRALRDEVPEPDAARLASGRARLVAAASGRRSGRRSGPRVPAWRLAAAGTAVAVLGVPAAIAVLDGGPAREGGGRPPVSATPVSAAAFLESAARDVDQRFDHRPGDHQWIYTKVYNAGADPRAPRYELQRETWTRFDGLKSADYTMGADGKPKLEIEDEGWVKTGTDSEERTPAQWYDYLRTLPMTPGDQLSAMRKRADEYAAEMGTAGFRQGRDQWVFARLGHYLSLEQAMPEPGRAAIFRTLARIPGIEIRQGVRDALGRPGVGLTRTGGDGVRTEFILDPDTYTYRGMRLVNVKAQMLPYSLGKSTPTSRPVMKPKHVPAGKVLVDTALEATAMVQRPGQRP
ncbi:CU044_5270 family protein [Actinomadura sp. NAK00032]|uniref:CU044_5270 family protein n=1 Tax=Actinomadura sp. NAK00032 TaxID=2742128 RepID=UPI001591DA74|nr:CU044_5270 family protein [Actinomadura sp. NAK00032]QKW34233.1 CU044_5270 family protein [Actinomadura sp. NAK00032]